MVNKLIFNKLVVIQLVLFISLSYMPERYRHGFSFLHARRGDDDLLLLTGQKIKKVVTKANSLPRNLNKDIFR